MAIVVERKQPKAQKSGLGKHILKIWRKSMHKFRSSSFLCPFLCFRSHGQGQRLMSDLNIEKLDHGRIICVKFELLPGYGYRDVFSLDKV